MTAFAIHVRSISELTDACYTWEATIIGMEDGPTYHYGHSRAEVVAKVLAYMLEPPR